MILRCLRRGAVFGTLVIAVGFLVSTPLSVGTAAPKARKPIIVRMSEFTMKPSLPFVAAGKVTFTAKNVGTMKHEMVVVRVQPGAQLPTKPDGSVDEAAIPKTDKLGEVEHVKPKQSGKLTAKVAPGDYVLFCNIVNKSAGTTYVHYARGMHSTFTAG
jgi:uncharacterized cupredoxin-like copper-binding protein